MALREKNYLYPLRSEVGPVLQRQAHRWALQSHLKSGLLCQLMRIYKFFFNFENLRTSRSLASKFRHSKFIVSDPRAVGHDYGRIFNFSIWIIFVPSEVLLSRPILRFWITATINNPLTFVLRNFDYQIPFNCNLLWISISINHFCSWLTWSEKKWLYGTRGFIKKYLAQRLPKLPSNCWLNRNLSHDKSVLWLKLAGRYHLKISYRGFLYKKHYFYIKIFCLNHNNVRWLYKK